MTTVRPAFFLLPTAVSVSRALADVGINDHFMKTFTSMLTLGSSALFVLTRTSTPSKDRLLEGLRGLGGKVLMTSLSHEDASRLQAPLSAPRHFLLSSSGSSSSAT
jgi:uncharacterized membrane protein